MATCGYICPSCGGSGIKDDGSDCDWCAVIPKVENSTQDIEEWTKKVHEGPCCGDIGQQELEKQ